MFYLTKRKITVLTDKLEDSYFKQDFKKCKILMYPDIIVYYTKIKSDAIGNMNTADYLIKFTNKWLLKNTEKFLKFLFKNFRVKIDDYLKVFYMDNWVQDYFLIKNNHIKRLLFKENNITVNVMMELKEFNILISKGKNKAILQDKNGLNLWNGTMPKEIYCDLIKDSDIYQAFLKM